MPPSSPTPSSPAPFTPGDSCPCGFGAAYLECCGPFHAGERRPPTAEQLMRSRYCAFALHIPEYLASTWHPSTRPPLEELRERDVAWRRLTVTETHAGGPFDAEGTVTFVALGRDSEGGKVRLRECSRFVRADGRWLYVDGDLF